jgi:hypothetical protein
MQDQRRIIQPPGCMFLRWLFHAGAIVFLVQNRKYIRMHVGQKERMRVNDGGIIEETFTSAAVALTFVDVLIGRQKEGGEQRETSFESKYTAHVGVSMYQMARAIQQHDHIQTASNRGRLTVGLGTRSDCPATKEAYTRVTRRKCCRQLKQNTREIVEARVGFAP